MKILIVNTLYRPYVNGPVIYIENLERIFTQMGHSVTVFAGSKKPNKKRSKYSKLILFKEPEKNKSLSIYYNSFLKNASERIVDIEKEKYDFIITKTHVLLPLIKQKFNSKKVIFVIPSLIALSERFHNKKEIKKMTKEIASVVKGIKIVSLSNMIKEQIIKKLKINKNLLKKISIGIDVNKFNVQKKRNNYVLYLGRISTEKNVNSLITALSFSKNGKLLVVGDGSKLKEVISLSRKLNLQKKITFYGSKKNIVKYYNKSKIFVLPSTYDTFPLVLLEAMASGLPCIAFRPDGKKIITASDEIITNGKNGFLINNEKEMAEKIDFLMLNEDIRREMGENSRKTAEKYSWEKCATSLIDFSKE